MATPWPGPTHTQAIAVGLDPLRMLSEQIAMDVFLYVRLRAFRAHDTTFRPGSWSCYVPCGVFNVVSFGRLRI
jgi:hypothetical protein